MAKLQSSGLEVILREKGPDGDGHSDGALATFMST